MKWIDFSKEVWREEEISENELIGGHVGNGNGTKFGNKSEDQLILA